MTDLRNVADVLAKAAGLALELWAAAGERKPAPQPPWHSSHPGLEALNDKVQELAAAHPQVARAILEESISLSLARGLRRLMKDRGVDATQLLQATQFEPQQLEDILEGVSGATVSVVTLATLAQALDAKVQWVLVPNASPAQTETDLAALVKDAETLLAAPPTAGAP